MNYKSNKKGVKHEKNQNFLSIKECVKNGQYEITNHSYGTSSMGYLTNYKITINNKEHENKFNRKIYYICFFF